MMKKQTLGLVSYFSLYSSPYKILTGYVYRNMIFFAISVTCFSIFVNILIHLIYKDRCETHTATPDTSDNSTKVIESECQSFQEMMPFGVRKLVPPPSFSHSSDD